MKPLNIQIVAAQPGFFTVIDYGNDVDIGEPIIAWRVETYETRDGGELFSSCVPLTCDGDAVSNCIGVQNPDMTVVIFEGATYASLDALRQEKYPNAKAARAEAG